MVFYQRAAQKPLLIFHDKLKAASAMNKYLPEIKIINRY